MLEPEDYYRLAEICREMAGRAAYNLRGKGQPSYLLGLAEIFERDAMKAASAFAGSKPTNIRKSTGADARR
jgi:hypothetical protein